MVVKVVPGGMLGGGDQVCEWLAGPLALGEHCEAFRAARVDGAGLAGLDDADLERELGVAARLHRRKILTRVKQMLGR